MAKQIIWAPLARSKRAEILHFWTENNKSAAYNKKLNVLFKKATHLISQHPFIGKPTPIDNIRFKVIRHYLMFYEITKNEIHILTIWDSRQDPEEFKIPDSD